MSIEDIKRLFLENKLQKRTIFLFLGIIFLVLLPILPVFAPSISRAQAETSFVDNNIIKTENGEAGLIQNNSFDQSISHFPPKPNITVIERIDIVATAYSSTIHQTDDTPLITASGSWVRDGIIASNLLPFGTKVRIPQYFGDKIFVVEDRMNKRVGDLQIDIWFPSEWQAINFGVKHTYIETIK